jgi:hypothetical protein
MRKKYPELFKKLGMTYGFSLISKAKIILGGENVKPNQREREREIDWPILSGKHEITNLRITKKEC